MGLLRDADREAVKRLLDAMPSKVRLVHFTQTLQCDSCRDARGLLEEIAPLSDKLELEVLNLQIEKERAAAHGVDKVPATIVLGDGDRGVRYLGVPSGYEFGAFLRLLDMVARGDSGLEPASRQRLAGVADPIHLQVFVTPT